MDTMPVLVADYLRKNKYSLLTAAYLFVNKHGIIGKAGGNFAIYNLEKPEEGVHVTEKFLFLEGITSGLEKELLIPDVHVNAYSRASIAVIPDQNGYWVVFHKSLKDDKEWEQTIQQHNEWILEDEANKVLGSAKLLADTLSVLNYMVWEKENDYYRLKTYPSDWFLKLYPDLEKEFSYADLSEYFPFLATFLDEAEEVWGAESSQTASSELWTETCNNGSEIYLQAIAANPQGRALLIIGTHNISAQDRRALIQKAREKSLYNEQLEKTEMQLRKLLKFKNQFVSIVSHDLRSPLSGVIAGFEYILSDSEITKNLDENTQILMQEMKEELNAVMDYNQKLYHWSNLELGRFNMEPKIVDISSLLSRINKRFSEQTRQKNIELRVEYENFKIYVDDSLFSQALNNLVQNAVKFTQQGKKVTVSAMPGKNHHRITVTDEGIGIPDEIQDDLFNKVIHNHSQGTNGEKGSGLGLSITKNILDAHDMPLTFFSKEGLGTSFYIDIPNKG